VLVNPLNRQKGLMGEMMHGGLAEKCLVAQHQLIRMPDKVSFAQAAALPVAYGTAHRMIVTHKTIEAGEKVVVLGASGGVGTGCVLLAKMLGAEVVACASSADKIQTPEGSRRRSRDQLQGDGLLQVGDREVRKPQRRSYEGGADVVVTSPRPTPGRPDAAVCQARRQDPRLRRDCPATIRRKTCVTSGASS